MTSSQAVLDSSSPAGLNNGEPPDGGGSGIDSINERALVNGDNSRSDSKAYVEKDGGERVSPIRPDAFLRVTYAPAMTRRIFVVGPFYCRPPQRRCSRGFIHQQPFFVWIVTDAVVACGFPEQYRPGRGSATILRLG